MGEAWRRLTLPSEPASVGVASGWIRALGAEFGLTPEEIYRLDLCAGELITNIVSYAFADGAPHRIQLRARVNARTASLEISDDGQPFDPLAWRPPAPAATLEEARVGGWGIALVQRFADESRYIRRDGRNVLSLVLQREGARGKSAPQRLRGADRRQAGPQGFPLLRTDGTAVRTDERSGIDRRILGFISTFELLRGIPYHLVEDSLADCRIMRFADGQVLLRPGERNEAIAFVLSGRLRVHLDAPDSTNFFTAEVGEFVGELSVIDGRPVSAFVVADAGCRLLLLGADAFFDRLLTIPAVNRNFLRTLAARVRRTSDRIAARIRSELELEQLQRDLRFAESIQAGMLPHESPLLPDRSDVDCAARLRAARQVGGDFYDAFFVDSNRLFVTIGDVCGKGLPAALFMVRALTLLRSEAGRRPGARRAYLQRLVERFNRLLLERNDASLYASAFCAVLDTSTGLLAYVNAGHNPPAIALGDGRFEFLAGPRNLVAGIVDGVSYTGGELQLTPGSVLFLYTDGVVEAENPRRDQFGPDRLLATLDGARGGDATSLIDATVAAVDAFATGVAQADDITALALRYLGPSAT